MNNSVPPPRFFVAMAHAFAFVIHARRFLIALIHASAFLIHTPTATVGNHFVFAISEQYDRIMVTLIHASVIISYTSHFLMVAR
jgi:hypothetical protein